MCFKVLFITYSFLSMFVDSTYIDQSQSGDLNVQVDLKGLQIIALMKGGKEEYVDYDYAYDYSEMTIKPQNRTTPRPLNVTSTTGTTEPINNVTVATTAFFETTISTTRAADVGGVTSDQTVNYNNSTNKYTVSDYVTEPPALRQNTTIEATTTSLNNTRNTLICKKGFVQNSKGDCELKLQETGNALLKLVKLSQRLKLRRENKSDLADSE